jgi:hypothetical protein
MISGDPELPKKKAEALFGTLLTSDVHVLNLPTFTDNSLI